MRAAAGRSGRDRRGGRRGILPDRVQSRYTRRNGFGKAADAGGGATPPDAENTGREGSDAVLHAISLTAVLCGTWLLLSGHFTALPMLFGVLSLAVAVGIALRMDVVDHESHPVHLTWRIPAYWMWLLVQIVKSNFDVARTILGAGDPPAPNVVTVKPSQRTELGQVIHANSITLTPGTIAIELEDGEITVHALTRASADALATGVMDERVSRLEGAS